MLFNIFPVCNILIVDSLIVLVWHSLVISIKQETRLQSYVSLMQSDFHCNFLFAIEMEMAMTAQRKVF